MAKKKTDVKNKVKDFFTKQKKDEVVEKVEDAEKADAPKVEEPKAESIKEVTPPDAVKEVKETKKDDGRPDKAPPIADVALECHTDEHWIYKLHTNKKVIICKSTGELES